MTDRVCVVSSCRGLCRAHGIKTSASTHPQWISAIELSAHPASQQIENAAANPAHDPKDADALCRSGLALSAAGRRTEALEAFNQALKIKPDHAPSYFALGHEALRSEQHELAERFLRMAVALDPGHRDAHRDLSFVLRRKGLLEEAIASARFACAGPGVSPVSLCGLATALTLHGDPEGLICFEHLVRSEPEQADWRRKWSEGLLLHGDYEAGWREHRRWMALGGHDDAPRSFTQPAWHGEPLEGRTILLYAEQGLGDTLQFLRYLPLVAEQGGPVVLEVQPELHRLLAPLVGSVPGLAACLPRGTAVPFDTHAALPNLGAIFNSRLDSLPPPLDLPVRQNGKVGSALQVGLAWAGNPQHWNDRLRSMPLECFRPLGRFAGEGIRFVSLQLGTAVDEPGPIAFAADLSGVRDYADTAALLSTLDLVITVDTSIAHLAGSMGKPVWILLARVQDWRWGLHSSSTPWYPSARLFRQRRAGDWQPVIAEVAAALEQFDRSVSRAGRSEPGADI